MTANLIGTFKCRFRETAYATSSIVRAGEINILYTYVVESLDHSGDCPFMYLLRPFTVVSVREITKNHSLGHNSLLVSMHNFLL